MRRKSTVWLLVRSVMVNSTYALQIPEVSTDNEEWLWWSSKMNLSKITCQMVWFGIVLRVGELFCQYQKSTYLRVDKKFECAVGIQPLNESDYCGVYRTSSVTVYWKEQGGCLPLSSRIFGRCPTIMKSKLECTNHMHCQKGTKR